jgi:hypothetical protein
MGEMRYKREAAKGSATGSIKAKDIIAGDITAGSVEADKITADRIKAKNIRAKYISVRRRRKRPPLVVPPTWVEWSVLAKEVQFHVGLLMTYGHFDVDSDQWYALYFDQD